MKLIRNFAEVALFLSPRTANHVTEILMSLPGVDSTQLLQFDFTDLLGGPIHLIENTSDLAAVQLAETDGDRQLSVIDSASEWFDIAQWIDDGHYAWLVIVEGNGGGPQYLIPRRIADQIPNVEASIRLTKERTGT